MCDVVPLTIYSPNSAVRVADYLKVGVAGITAAGLGGLRHAHLLHRIESMPVIRRAQRIASPMRWPVHPRLAKLMHAGVYGLEYFRVLRDSNISLNIHANSSLTHASNIRLYEATGVGSCLLTDWKDNLADLYEPDTEVTVYRSLDEAIEKAEWLASHPRERESIAAAGMRRTLSSHTFSHRAEQIAEIIREAVCHA
jgi:hypothetical protein